MTYHKNEHMLVKYVEQDYNVTVYFEDRNIQTVVLLCLLMCCNVRLVTFDNYSAHDTN